jgi:predicted DNA-binding protein
MLRTNIYLPKVTLSALKKISESTGLSVAEIIRRAIDEYLNKTK